MDAQRFDHIARTLSTTPSHRLLMTLAQATADTAFAALVAVRKSEEATAGGG
jgi:hypothetical protein